MKNYLFLSLILLSNSLTYGQQNVGIGTDNPNPNAVLDLESDDKGFLMPRLNTNARNTLGTLCGPNEEGLVVYDTEEDLFLLGREPMDSIPWQWKWRSMGRASSDNRWKHQW